ncbi:ABC-three component system protein [Amycolatopsis pittospori]|uniref:ABC-three component system protein n=1 Tax=Amycolatopsis pittospori TaxID=2749434 RepID=UPI0015F062B1|nr:ABC-three component system protein [Amycolatopsis pittospori]
MALQFIERQAVRYLVKMKLAELHGNSFEDFFQSLMCLRDPSFIDVRTAGQLGDQGSDGLLLHIRKLYACYAPEVFDAAKTVAKFESDFQKAKTKRADQFDKFVFVHNDLRGVHPVISTCLAEHSKKYNDIKFEQFGYRHFRDESCRLELDQVEDLLGMALPVQELAYGVALEELEPLLAHLREGRVRNFDPTEISAVSKQKLDYNRFSEDVKDELRRSIIRSADIDAYYQELIDITERDEVAAAFREEFLRICDKIDEPDDILWQLEQYVLGNASAPIRMRKAALAILAYFFQSCDIFNNPPPGWNASLPAEKSA